VIDTADFTRNVLPFVSQLEEDEAGPDPEEISHRYGLSVESIAVLSRNENPYGPSPRLAAALRQVPLHRYPNSQAFLKAISIYTGYPEEYLVAGAGMDEIITTICRIFLGAGGLCI
jgi:histidinol-phosphate aminotransferase